MPHKRPIVQTHRERLQTAWNNGYKAFQQGKDVAANPYERYDYHLKWFQGWKACYFERIK